jgi:peptidyl-prolyl cis-trans isomerase D
MIVILISIPFALWGVNEYFAGGGDINVATVNGEDISQQDYRFALEDQRNALRRALGDNFDPDQVNSEEFKRGVLDDLITQTLLTTSARESGHRMGDVQLSDFIREAPRFQRDGKFDETLYERAVAGMGLSPPGFEAQLRQQSVLQQVRDGYQQTAFITAEDEKRLLELALQERTFDYATVLPQRFEKEIQISEEQIKQEYENNSDAYRRPDRIKVQYVQLRVSDLAEGIEPDEEAVRRLYENSRERFVTPEQRRASHILLQVDENAADEQQQQALEQAQSLLQRVKAGEDFAALAGEFSQDPGSAAQGGDLGVIVKGAMVKPFEDTVLGMAEGEVSEPVKTRFGYHLIKLTELKGEQVKPFEEVRGQLKQEERRRQAEAIFIDQAETFRNLAYEQPETLEPVVEELGLELKTSDWFSREIGAGIAASPKVREAAFADDVFREGLNSEAIELDLNSLLALRRLEAEPSKLRPLEEVADDIEAKLKRAAAQEKARTWGEEQLEELRKGASWDGLLTEHALEMRNATRRRSGFEPQPRRAVRDEVFRVPAPDDQQPTYGGVALDDGGYVLFRVTAVEPGDSSQADDQLKQRVANALKQRRGLDDYLSYRAGLRDKADIKVYADQL